MYLLGTMHVGVDPVARLPQLVWDKLDASPIFAVETEVTDKALANIGARTSGTLHEELGPEYWKKLELAITPQVTRQLDGKSAMIPATLLALRGLPMTPPTDGVLLGRAKNRGKPVVYLEPAAILEKHMNAKALKMIDDLATLERQSQEMLAAYIAGDEAKIEAITNEQRKGALAHGYTAAEYDESMEDLLYRRNASWILVIAKLHAGGGGFVAVGAARLIGVRSVLDLIGARTVLDLLQQKGYRLARLTPPAAGAGAPPRRSARLPSEARGPVRGAFAVLRAVSGRAMSSAAAQPRARWPKRR